MLCKLVAARSAGGDRDRSRAKRFSTGDVARRVADNVDLGRGELAAVFFFCPSASESPKLVAVSVVVGTRTKNKKSTDPRILQFQGLASPSISRDARDHDTRALPDATKQLTLT